MVYVTEEKETFELDIIKFQPQFHVFRNRIRNTIIFDPVGFDSDPTFEKKPDPDPTLEKQPGPSLLSSQ